jgi:signal peptidase I
MPDNSEKNSSRALTGDSSGAARPAASFFSTWDEDNPADRHALDPMIAQKDVDTAPRAAGDPFSDGYGGWQPNMPLEPLDARPTLGNYLARGIRDFFETIIPAIIIALLINLFLAQATRVYGQSMEPNLHTDQRLVVEKLSYSPWLHLRSPQRGDVVVVRMEGSTELLIKRVIGLPGDLIQITNGQVYVNGAPLEEPYIAQAPFGDFGPVDVPALHLFVMGDNRNFSNDSRSFGPVAISRVIGRAWFSYWPPEDWGAVR